MIACPNCGEENPAKFRLCGFCGSPLAAPVPVHEVRKLVTILFCDLKGSTSLGETLDSESLREVMTRYFDAMSAAITHHGGTIEKYIGDAVMAVFGLPRVREDDALRAVRAAVGMQAALEELNDSLQHRYGVRIANRIGINTGEVVAGDPTTGQRLVTGDPVNVAARLEQAAGESEALIGDLTYRLVQNHVDAESVEPLELKGKSQRVPAFRLVALRDGGASLSSRSRLVGRERELDVVTSELGLAESERSARLVTILAEPGVGKSRLLAEVAARTDEHATFASGRCLSYGRGITFWPLIEIARTLASIAEDDPPDRVREKLLAATAGNANAAARIAAVAGVADQQFGVEETFWAARRLFEVAAAQRPLVVCFEDVHWAEQTLLDLVEYAVQGTNDAAVLFICTARPTLFEIREGWEREGRTLVLEPLSSAESEEMIRAALGDAELPPAALARIVEAAGGNPLYVGQIVSMLVEEGTLREEHGRWVASDEASIRVPPTIQALLSARLDHLSDAERAVVTAASVIGQVFAEAAVAELVPEVVTPQIPAQLASLTQKRLVRPEPGSGPPTYRFDHILIRDTAYQSLLKRTRATLHEQFVGWAERVNRERDRSAEYDDILGYHLEQAYTYLAELGPVDDHGRSLGNRGAEKLAAAGRRAFTRGDMPAAANLLRRAAGLREEHDPERHLLVPMLAEALMEIGEFAWAETVLEETRAAGTATGDSRLLEAVELTNLYVRHRVVDDLGEWREQVLEATGRLIPELERLEAHELLAKAWRLLAIVHTFGLQYGRLVEAAQRALEHARAARDDRLEERIAAGYTLALCLGPMPVPEAITRCQEVIERLSNRQAEAVARGSLAMLLAMADRVDDARREYRAAAALLADLRGALPANVSIAAATVELLAGNLDTVVSDLRVVYEDLGRLGERYYRPIVGAMLALALERTGESDEARALVSEVAEETDPGDLEALALVHTVNAKHFAAGGDYDRAIETARQAVTLLDDADSPVIQANVLAELGDVLLAAGELAPAQEAIAAAVERHRLKGNVLGLSRLSVSAKPS